VTTSGTLVSSGDVSLSASSDHDLETTADATPTTNQDANGFAVAVNVTSVQDEAFVGGAPTINAPTLHIETGGGNNFMALARSGAAGIGDANAGTLAGAIALNTGMNLSHAYVADGSTLTLIGNTDVTIAAANTTVTDLSAEPQGAAVIATELGVGRSFAANASVYTTEASVGAGAQIIGAHDLSVTANGDQTQFVTAYAGTLAADFGVIEDLNQVTLAGSISQNSTVALIDAGATASIGGALTVQSTHHATNLLRSRSDAAALAGEGENEAFATPIVLNLANDMATATVAGMVVAAGLVNISADADVENQSEAIAGVQGADPDSTGASALVEQEIDFLSDRANLAFGSAPTVPLDPSGPLDLLNNRTQGIAAALAVNLSSTTANAEITSTGDVTATNSMLNVTATSDADSASLGSAGAVESILGIAAGVALNAQLSNTIASISGAATADGILIETGASGDGVQTVSADSVSGVGAVAAGVAGAAAVTQAQGISNAFIGNGATLTLTNGGDLAVQAGMEIDNVANATPRVEMLTTFGVGASFELNSGVFRTVAEIRDAEILGAHDVSVVATGDYETVAEAEAGVSAGSGIGAAIAAMITDNRTTAEIAASTVPSTITGNLVVSADHSENATHTANADVNATEIGAGAAIALGVMQGRAEAFAGNSMTVGGATSVSAVRLPPYPPLPTPSWMRTPSRARWVSRATTFCWNSSSTWSRTSCSRRSCPRSRLIRTLTWTARTTRSSSLDTPWRRVIRLCTRPTTATR